MFIVDRFIFPGNCETVFDNEKLRNAQSFGAGAGG